MFEPLFALPIAVLSLTQPIPQKIAVKIFPHLHDYPPEGLDTNPASVRLRSASACGIYIGNTDSPSSSRTLRASVSGLDVTLTSAALATPLWIQCEGRITVLRQGAKENYAYGGPIYARAVKSGPELIEVKPLNDYLRGVVPSEMPASWPEEALQAQAIAARTYAVFHMLLAREPSALSAGPGDPNNIQDLEDPGDQHPFFDVDDTVLYQAYTGETDRAPSSDEAVETTGSTVLTYGGKVIQAYFSADAGGYTEEADHVWPVVAPYCQSKPEPFEDNGLDGGRWGPWTASFPLSEVNQRLKAEDLIPGANPIVNLSIDPSNRYVSGRAHFVTLGLADGSSKEIGGLVFQHALGLKSTLITLQVDSGVLRVNGRGFGHGVGMSQYGARLAALNGWGHSRILNFYYTGVQSCEITADGGLECLANPPNLP